MFRGFAVAFAVAVAVAPLAAAQPGSKSAQLAKQLAQLMDAKKLDSIAGADSQNLGTYVAAPPLLNEKIGNKNYRDVYIDLNSASVAGSKMLVEDLQADGLVARPDNQPADTYDMGGKSIVFNGDWKKAKMSEAEYTKAYAQADEAYAHALEILINQLKSST